MNALRKQFVRITLPLEDQLPVAIVRKKPQVNSEFHQHEGCVELVVITEGEGSHVWKSAEGESRRRPLAKGNVFVVHKNETHRYENANGLELVSLVFRPLEQWLPIGELFAIPGYYALFYSEPYVQRAYQTRDYLRLEPAQLSRSLGWVAELEQEISDGATGYQFASKGILMQLLAFLSRAYPKVPRPAPLSRQTQALKGVSHALAYIESHYAEEISFETLRSIAKMSHSGLLRAFRHCVGQSPIDYVIHTRIAKAKQFLTNSSLNVSEVSIRVGFNDPNYFSRKFKAVTNVTPRQYRQEILGQVPEETLA